MKLECKNALSTYNKLKKEINTSYIFLFFGEGGVNCGFFLNTSAHTHTHRLYIYFYIYIKNSSNNNQPPSVKLVNKERKIDGVAMLLTGRNLRLLKGGGRWPCRADIACGERSYTRRKFCCNRLFIFLSRFRSWKVMFRYFGCFYDNL